MASLYTTDDLKEELERLVGVYCRARNLVVASYLEGMYNKGPLDDTLLAKLIEYHREWVKGIK